MTNKERILEMYQHQMTQTTQVFFGFLAFTILLMVFLSIYKKKQREIFWAAGVTLFISLLLLVTSNVLDLNKRLDLVIVGCGLFFSGFYVYVGEKAHKKSNKPIPLDAIETKHEANSKEPDKNEKVQEIEQNNVESSKDDKENQSGTTEQMTSWIELLPPSLATDIAIKVFDRAISDRLLTVEDGYLQWHGKSKTLLAYMCGKIYCDDFSEYEKVTGKNIWKQGKNIFPDTALNSLFKETALAQSRKNRELAQCPEGFRKIDGLFK